MKIAWMQYSRIFGHAIFHNSMPFQNIVHVVLQVLAGADRPRGSVVWCFCIWCLGEQKTGAVPTGLSMFDLTGKVAVVTGATGRVGAALVRSLGAP